MSQREGARREACVRTLLSTCVPCISNKLYGDPTHNILIDQGGELRSTVRAYNCSTVANKIARSRLQLDTQARTEILWGNTSTHKRPTALAPFCTCTVGMSVLPLHLMFSADALHRSFQPSSKGATLLFLFFSLLWPRNKTRERTSLYIREHPQHQKEAARGQGRRCFLSL